MRRRLTVRNSSLRNNGMGVRIVEDGATQAVGSLPTSGLDLGVSAGVSAAVTDFGRNVFHGNSPAICLEGPILHNMMLPIAGNSFGGHDCWLQGPNYDLTWARDCGSGTNLGLAAFAPAYVTVYFDMNNCGMENVSR
jgi:hypothetical protein